MIAVNYSLYEYLRLAFPSIDFFVDAKTKTSPQTGVLIKDTGGDPMHWFDRTDWTIQFLSFAKNVVEGRALLYSVYEEMKNRFGLVIPSITVNGITYDEIKTAQISPIQTPGYLGTDDDGLHIWSFNIQVTTT